MGGHILKPTSCSGTIANVMSGELRFCVTECQENEDCLALWQPLCYCTTNVRFPNVQYEPPKPQFIVTSSCSTICQYREGCLFTLLH